MAVAESEAAWWSPAWTSRGEEEGGALTHRVHLPVREEMGERMRGGVAWLGQPRKGRGVRGKERSGPCGRGGAWPSGLLGR